MEPSFELKIEQSQKLIMTPALKQAITLLQFPTVQLTDYIQQQLVDNPILEIKDDMVDNETDEPEGIDQAKDFPWEEYFDHNKEYKLRTVREVNEYFSLENYIQEKESLQDFLLSQLRIDLNMDTRDYKIAEYLVGSLDDNGYFIDEIEEVSEILKVSSKRVSMVLHEIQQLEPAGIAARNLEECLLLQLRRKENVPSALRTIIKNCLPAVADGRYRYISNRLGINPLEVQKAIQFIQTLNPRPAGIKDYSAKTSYIVPDLFVEKVEGQYMITINDAGYRYLQINPYYELLLKNKDEEHVYSFIKKYLDSALWLMRSIEQRRLTLYRVAEQIIKIQNDFFKHGINYLKPLTLKDVASALRLHESTVSRTVSNKYLEAPRGAFPLKFFFTGCVPGDNEQVYSSLSIKNFIKEIIGQELSTSPYSDQELANYLKEQGIVISRRTVSKYRKEMLIPPSTKRKRQ